jgi:hypothetical protein
MPREKEYATNAQRQAAYRQRHQAQQLPREDYLAALGRSLHSELEDAVAVKQSVLPADLLGERADATLQNLIRYIRRHTERGKADPLLTPLLAQEEESKEVNANSPKP